MAKRQDDGPKAHITWRLNNDGLGPTKAPHGYVLRNPVSKGIPPGSKASVNLYVTADCPMFAWPTASHADSVTVPQFIPAGQEVVVVIENKSQHSVMLVETKEGLVNLHPLLVNHDDLSDEVG